MNKKNINPFIYQGYNGPEYFCDRKEETRSMVSALYNGRNITLISPRRLGKTGLIWHTFQHIQSENKDALCLYIDIFPTKNQQELASMLGSAVLNTAMSKGKAFGKKVLDLMAALRPMVGLDSMTGLPNVTVNIDSSQSEVSLGKIFNQLNHLGKEVFVAIDEFQQIASYPETGTEALLRSHIQFLSNVHFVFSGSKQHLMSEMFISPKRPFYQSTDLMNLKPIDETAYYKFANAFFEKKGGHLDNGAFHSLYTTFNGYTWYIQSVLNRLYENHKTINSIEQLNNAILSVAESKSPQYESLTQFLTNNQFAVLKAIAKDGLVEEPTGKDFLKRHHLSSASSIKTALGILLDKELVYRQTKGYIIYDRFLDLWLKRL